MLVDVIVMPPLHILWTVVAMFLTISIDLCVLVAPGVYMCVGISLAGFQLLLLLIVPLAVQIDCV